MENHFMLYVKSMKRAQGFWLNNYSFFFVQGEAPRIQRAETYVEEFKDQLEKEEGQKEKEEEARWKKNQIFFRKLCIFDFYLS